MKTKDVPVIKYVYIYIYTVYIYTVYTRIHKHTHTHTHTCVCIHIHIHIYIYIYIYIYIHIHIHILTKPFAPLGCIGQSNSTFSFRFVCLWGLVLFHRSTLLYFLSTRCLISCLCVVCLVVLHVSHPYSITCFIVELNMRILVMYFELQIFLSIFNTTLAL